MEGFSLVLSALMAIVIVLYPFWLGSYLSQRFKQIKSKSESTLFYTTVIPVHANLPSLYFYPIFLAKRLLFGVILIALDTYVYIQTVLMVVYSIAVRWITSSLYTS